MKLIDGLYWPDSDIDCRKASGLVVDIDKVLPFVRKFDFCLQAGGNIGIWPKRLARSFRTVMTFEPHPENFECLEMNCVEKNIICHQNALSDRREQVFVRPPNKEHEHNCGAHQIFPDGDIDTIRIDDLDLSDCDLIYLDIEGYELKALHGAVDTIQMHHPIIVFEDKELPFMYGKKVGDVEKWLRTFGYSVVDRFHRDIVCAYFG